MIAYIDASVLMRIVLNAPNPLREWPELREGISSQLLKTEALRTLDQLWHRGQLTEEELTIKRERLDAFLPHVDLLPLDENILNAAAMPLPTILGTLDAIHLATALRCRAAQLEDERPLLFATHDHQLARAARAMNFEVIGA